MGVLGQESVAGMDGVDVGHLGRRDDPGDVQVRLGGRPRADADRPVRQVQVPRAPVRLRVDRDRLDPHLLAGSDDPQGDLAAIGYQDA